jgi:uncharacterized metal-binding protein YceD (DUF177 family)
MLGQLQIYISDLANGQKRKIKESLDPSFFELQENELQFKSIVEVKGETYLSESDLVVHLRAQTQALMPCAICNEDVTFPLEVHDFYHVENLDQIKDGIFNYGKPLREALLLEVPKYVECNRGKCPERSTIAPYMKGEKEKEKDTYFPFSNLDS